MLSMFLKIISQKIKFEALKAKRINRGGTPLFPVFSNDLLMHIAQLKVEFYLISSRGVVLKGRRGLESYHFMRFTKCPPIIPKKSNIRLQE